MKRAAFALGFISLFSIAAFAQDLVASTAPLPLQDGVVAAGEYQFTSTQSGIKVSATLGADNLLYLAIEAPTKGWVALGTGSAVMDGARLFIAWEADGKGNLSEQVGAGHYHAVATDSLAKKWALKTNGGTTSFELVVPASAAISGGKVVVLASYAATASLTQRHAARVSLSLTVKN